ncbi:hypothetical protein BaRGS_00033186, partial [Batillaria attramentaria]
PPAISMSGKRYNFTEFTEDGEEGVKNGSTMGGRGGGRESGCHVTTAVGFVLVLLSVLVAVVVGLVVHFAEKDSYDRDVICSFPDDVMALLSKQNGGDATPASKGTNSPSSQLSPGTTQMPATASPTRLKRHRLPPNLKPIYYDLEIKPDFYGNDPSTFSFTGHVTIHLECISPTNEIVLNSKNLSIAKSTIRVTEKASGAFSEVMSVDLEDDTEVMVIKVKEELGGGKQYTVEIQFEGPLTDDLAGLYLSSYKRGNQTVYLATTQFESPDAREAFPCFDEPALKAHFNVTILRRPALVSLSNTQIARTEDRGDGWMADVYETTPKMSTYLLAIIVCDFGFINGTTNKSVEFEVWARRELLNQTQYALYAGMKILDYYGDFFGIDFPLKKQAMVAIPDFAAGAMENWGLITYRETYLTVQEGVTSERTKNLVTLYIAHELAHQWFGNLVTLAWWDDLWLNEGFAEFVEYIGMDMIDKSWKVWEQFVVDSVQYSFVLDQLATSHPLYSPVEAVEDAEQYFDDISYEKGASVIRMIQFCMGEDTFQRGIKRYLQAHSYANANHTDLWNALAAQTEAENKNLDIPSIMNTWTLQMGFPVVHVTRGAGDVMVKQKRFLINPDATDPGTFHSPYGYMWHVPITLTSSEESHFNVTEKDVVWLTEKEKMFTPTVKLADRDDPAGWILANVLQYGYYRVIPPINRAQIIDDAWNLASAGETEVDIALGTLEYLEAEMDYVPWKSASLQIADLKTHMVDTSGFGALNRFIQDRTRPVFRKLGLNDRNAAALESYTRATVASIACGVGLPDCVNQATQLFSQWRDDPDSNPISPALRSRVYCTALEKGDESDWFFALSRYRQEESPNEKRLLLRSLACSSRVWILSTLLEMSLEGVDIKRDNAISVIGWVAQNPVGTRLAWDFIRGRWGTIMSDFSQSSSRLKFMINAIASTFHEDFHLSELQDFMQEADDLGPAEQALNQAVETVEFNLKWYKDSYPKIVQWLNDKGYHEFEGGETAERTLTKEDILLPTDIRPLHYDLRIEPLMYGDDPGKFTFNGTLTMTFNCVKATDQIVLHANELEVDNFILDTTGKTAPAVISSRTEEDKQFLIIRLDAQLTAGQNYSVKMDFRGPLDKDLDGLYLSSYKDGNRTVGEDRVVDKFETSLPMSTYLVALIVCEFENKTKYTSGHNIRYEVWGRPAVRDQLDFALNLGVDVIDFYEGYFNINFPLPKQCVSSWGNKESTSMTIAHELAHMWFGDLVSPLWWDEIWLNEGFARFMQYLATDHQHPDWKEWDRFVTDVVHSGMQMDGFVSSHPGASIIRMIRHAIGQDTFKNGITNYLNKLRYRNANHTDLWNALNDQAKRDGESVNVGDVMDTWTLQMNYPVVMVARQGQNLTLKQQRFLKDPTAKDPEKFISPFGYTWEIPFTFTTSAQRDFNETKEVGYYRVNYDDDNWHRLSQQLTSDHTVIDPVNRAQIINDAWNLAGGGYLNQSIALSVVEYLDKEEDYVPWTAASAELGYVKTMLATQSFLVPSRFTRALIVSIACANDVDDCVNESKRLFSEWKTTDKT